jgi:hypothetical protein
VKKHNPSPWTYENVEDRSERSAHGIVRDANSQILFDTLNSDVTEICEDVDEDFVHRWDEAARRNLTLAAAAPEMQFALKEFVRVNALRGYEFGSNEPELFNLIIEAIAKGEMK